MLKAFAASAEAFSEAVHSRRAGGVGKGAAMIADQGLVSGCNVLLAIFLARWLAAPEFGAYSVLYSSFVLVLGLHNAFLIEPLSVFSGGIFRDSLLPYLRRCLRLHVTIVLGSLPVVALIAYFLAPAPGQALRFAAALVMAGAFFLLYLLVRRFAYAAGMQLHALAGAVVMVAVTSLSAGAAAIAGTLSWTSGLMAQAAGGAAATIVLWALLARVSSPRPAAEIAFSDVVSRHCGYGRWAVATAVAFWFSAEVYCVLAARLLGHESAAGFRVVVNLTMMLPNFIAAVAVLTLPRAAGLVCDGNFVALGRFVRAFAAASLAAALVVGAVLLSAGGRLLGWLYGQQYEQYAGILPPLVVNMTLLAGSQAIQTKVRAANRPRYIFEAFLGGALCSCTVGLALMVRYGLEGGCLGLCCSTMTSVAVLLARSRTRSPEAAGPETAAIVDRRPRACAAGPNRG